MPNKPTPEMRIPPHRSREASKGPDPSSERGRRRTIDVDPNSSYLPLSIKVSERFHERVHIARAIKRMSLLEFMLFCMEPEVSDILKERGLE